MSNPLDIDIDDEFERLDAAHNVINRQMFKIDQLSTVLVHENNQHRHPPRMMITDLILIQKYNEELLPSVKSMCLEMNEKASKRITRTTTQESENQPNKETIEFVTPSNKNTIESVTTGKDVTPIGRGLRQIGPFCFPAYIFRDDEIQESLLGLNPQTKRGCSAMFTNKTFSLHHEANREPILYGSKNANQNSWRVAIQQ